MKRVFDGALSSGRLALGSVEVPLGDHHTLAALTNDSRWSTARWNLECFLCFVEFSSRHDSGPSGMTAEHLRRMLETEC